MQLDAIGVQFLLRKTFHHAATLHHIIAVRHGRGEMEILLHQYDRKALLLEGADGAADVLDDSRRQTLGWLVKQ